MSIRNIASKVEDLQTGIWGLSSLILAVEDAVFHGTWAPKEYEGAVCALHVISQNLEKEAEKIVDAAYKEIQNHQSAEG